MDYIDMERFYNCLKEKQGKRGVSVIAREIGVSTSTLQALLRGEFRTGLFELNANVCGAFFKVCDWLGVPANTFLIEDTAISEISIGVADSEERQAEAMPEPTHL